MTDEPVQIKYGPTAIAKGKRLAWILKKGDAAEMELGELADRLQPKYGEKTLERFAQAIDLPLDRLNRCRSVYRAYKGIDIQGASPNFAVRQALQAHPLREEIIKENPELTMREARTLMKDWRTAHAEEAQTDPAEEPTPAPTQEPTPEPAPAPAPAPTEPWEVIEARRWFDSVMPHVMAIIHSGHPSAKHLDAITMLCALRERLQETIAAFRLCGKVSTAWADAMEQALKPPPAPMFDDKPSEAAPDQAAPE